MNPPRIIVTHTHHDINGWTATASNVRTDTGPAVPITVTFPTDGEARIGATFLIVPDA